MVLQNIPQMFSIYFPHNFFYKEVNDKWLSIVKRMKLPYESIEDFMNSQIQSLNFPGIQLEPATQEQGQFNIKYPTGKELEPLMDKNLSITFKLTESYISYWIIFDQMDYYLKYNKNNKSCYMDSICMSFLSNSGFALVTFIYKLLVPTNLSTLSLSYAAQAANFNTFNWDLSFNRYDIL